MSREQRLRLAVLTLHPIHYQAALWRRLAQEPDLDLTVYFCTAAGLDTADARVGYGCTVDWGTPMLQGYRYKFLRNFKLSQKIDSFWCRVNPGIFPALVGGAYEALFVHSYHNCTQVLAILAGRCLGTRVLIRSEPTPLLRVNPGRRRIKDLVLPWLFRRVDACMAIGSLNREYYRLHGVPEDKIFLMPYAVDNDYFFEQRRTWGARAGAIKQALGINAAKVVLYVGRFAAGKQVSDLIRAFERLAQPGVALVLVGTGAEWETCRQYVQEHRLPEVHFLGFRNQTELPQLYAMADVFVLPSGAEPWGLVVNEAMCFGLPVIASDRVGAAADLVKPGSNGFVYPAGDVPALAQLLEQVLEDGASERLGQASLEKIGEWGLEEDVAAMRRALSLPPRPVTDGAEPGARHHWTTQP